MSDPEAGVAFAASLLRPPDRPDATAYDWLPPAPTGTPVTGLIQHAAHRVVLRRRSIRQQPGLLVPLPPATLRTGPRAGARRWLASGVVALGHTRDFPPLDSPLGQIARDSRVKFPQAALWLGSGGSLVAPGVLDGAEVVLRVYPPSMRDRHEHAVRTLLHLGAASLRWAPWLVSTGETLDRLWLVESRLPGSRPGRLSDRLSLDVVDLCVDLPAAWVPPTTTGQRLPDVLDPVTLVRLRRLGGAASGAWADVSPVGTHGDLWLGNLLQTDGTVSGVVDWDAYRNDQVPGLDVVHLVATSDRLRHRRSMGAELLTRPWTREPLRSLGSRYFERLDLRVDADRWEATGIAWWLGQVADTLERTPQLALDERWTERNVGLVLDALE